MFGIFGKKKSGTPDKPPPEPRIEPLNQAEQEWIAENLRAANSFVKRYCTNDNGDDLPASAALDKAWAAWLRHWESKPQESREDPNPTINAVGIALGQHLATALGLRWVVATDQYGTEMALHGQPGNILVFPPNLVGKRFANRTTGFVAPLIEQMCTDIRRAQGTTKPAG
jgi:hypothetical protein